MIVGSTEGGSGWRWMGYQWRNCEAPASCGPDVRSQQLDECSTQKGRPQAHGNGFNKELGERQDMRTEDISGPLKGRSRVNWRIEKVGKKKVKKT